MIACAHFIAVVAALGAVSAQPLDANWQILGEGRWEVIDDLPFVVWQGDPDATTSAVRSDSTGTGNVWRCLVEPGIGAERVGIWFAAAADLKRGFLLTLGGTPGVGGVELRDAAGTVLWRDKHAPWSYYVPYILEGVVEPGRVRVQMLQWDGSALLAQSDWIEAPDANPTDAGVLALHTEKSVGRFCKWERNENSLSPIVADSPTKMRLVSDENSDWAIVGEGDWRWTSPERSRIRQGAQMERSTAVNKTLGGAEGTWRCRVSADKGTCGAGMMMNVDEELKRGFVIWLGGTYGAGGLMLYRYPLKALWSSPQDKWHYNEEYVLEGTIKDGKVSARMLEADGTTAIAESPLFDLTEEEKGRDGHIGFMAWRGTAEFWDFSEGTRAGSQDVVASTTEEALALGDGWRGVSGSWELLERDGKRLLAGTGAEGAAVVVNDQARAAKGVYRATVVTQEGCQSVSLLFQMSEDLKKGFECRLGKGVLLRSLDGRDLWKKDDVAWKAGVPYTLEGIVVTDRVSLRVLDASGKVLVLSEECYVSDANNTRQGAFGFKVEGGPAQFSDWSVSPGE